MSKKAQKICKHKYDQSIINENTYKRVCVSTLLFNESQSTF
jgi:hypothetical protein